MKNIIYLDGLEIYAKHGLFEEEKQLGQKFIFDIECELNYKKAMLNDSLIDSVSYGDVAEDIYFITTNNTYDLLEKLSYEIVRYIFNKYSSIERIKLKINKPNAPITKIFKNCGTILEITRAEFLEF